MWLYQPSRYAPEPGRSTWGFVSPARSLASLLATSVTWKGKPTQSSVLYNASKTKSWMTLLFGQTSRPLIVKACGVKWVRSLPAFHARQFRLLERELGIRTQDGYGPTSTESSKTSASRLSQETDSSSCSSKTSTTYSGLTKGVSISASEDSWRSWVSWLRKESLARRKWARHIGGSGCSSWPTATSKDSVASGAAGYSTASGRHTGTTLTDAAVRQWPAWSTPRSSDGPNGGPNQRGSKVDLALPGQAANWSTPTTPGGGRSVSAETVASRGMTETGKRTVGLESEARHWSTPAASLHNDSEELASFETRRMNLKERGVNGNGEGTPLTVQSRQWPTPTRGDGERQSHTMMRGNLTPAGAATEYSLPAPMITTLGPDSSQTERILLLLYHCWEKDSLRAFLRLNPSFVNWLMGWPPGWSSTSPIAATSYRDWETASYRSALQYLSAYFGSGLEDAYEKGRTKLLGQVTNPPTKP